MIQLGRIERENSSISLRRHHLIGRGMIDLVQVLMNLGRWENRRWYVLFHCLTDGHEQVRAWSGGDVQIVATKFSIYVQVHPSLCRSMRYLLSILRYWCQYAMPSSKKPTRRNRRTTFQKQH